MSIIAKIRKNSFIILAVSGFILVSYGFTNNSQNRDFQLAKNMDIFFSIIREISLFYVDESDPEKLIENGISGVLNGLDPYTTYIPESEKENFATMTTGKYGGIGALIRQSGDYVKIVDPYFNFPAQKAGLKAGDLITAINGVSTKGLMVNEISELLKGNPKTSIEISIQRYGSIDPITKEIIRQEIKIDNVAWYGEVHDKIGYIQLNGFTENTHQEVKSAITDMKRNMEIESLILDVRGNPGGLLMEAIKVTNLFVKKGEEIVSTRGKVKQLDDTYVATNNPLDPDIPVIILVSGSSASAAEIVAGAFQDLDRGIVIGQRTFGKGLIQATRQLGYNAQLKITTAKYYTPSGRCIQSMDFTNREGLSYIPDSLINEFRTKNGRIVYDGGGILPDIEIHEDRPGPIVINLYSGNHIFNYATRFASENPSIPPVASFMITDSIYQNFVEYLESENFDYQTQTEANLKRLVNSAKQEKYYNVADEILSELEEILKHDKKQDLITFKEDIKSLLKEEIAGRYYYSHGRIEASLESDPYLEKAIQILSKKEVYNSILIGGEHAYKQPELKTPFQLTERHFPANNILNWNSTAPEGAVITGSTYSDIQQSV